MGEDDGIHAEILLLGGGHAHVEVIRRLGQLGLGARMMLVSPGRFAPYSGMLPGYIAGVYSFDDFHIDLAALCLRFGVTFLETSARHIDPEERIVRLAEGGAVGYRYLSVDIGSTPSLPLGISAGISVKPISSFTDRLGRLDALIAAGERVRLAVVGQGVAGVEVAFALKQRFAGRDVEIALIGRSTVPVPERSVRARQLVEKELQVAGLAHHPTFDVVGFQNGEVVARDGRRLVADEVIWTTSSGSQGFLRETGLLLDAGGFIRVDESLRSLSHPDIFAAGDVASLADPRPKAGVFAVRQGPVLADNIHRSLKGEPLEAYRPQRSWLVLISLPNGQAIADKWGLALVGRWVARWKDRIDRGFMQRYKSDM
ncbi:MAG: FAD-dependent oxidoreductase [Alphaproteobacteria bacterium]|nr:FAD-dependent oxidoreductase [Alphaproteobacteria bacterium]MBU0833629.1 FAD-dependent oxidoreductase [Alphaproteobacteria bacterium]MBU1764271.1 FAD-dependent oxidoreductase [Alphaproteobacteria bacterium]